MEGGGAIPTPNPRWFLQRADFRPPSSFAFFFCLREFGATPSTSQILGNFSKMLIFFPFFPFLFYLWEFGTIPSMLLTSAPSSRSRWALHSLTPHPNLPKIILSFPLFPAGSCVRQRAAGIPQQGWVEPAEAPPETHPKKQPR